MTLIKLRQRGALIALLAAVLTIPALVPGLTSAPAQAVDPEPAPTLTLTGPPTGKAGLPVTLTATLDDELGQPLAQAPVSLERLDSAWTRVAGGETDSSGQVPLTATLPLGSHSWRAVWAGDSTHAPVTSAVVVVRGVRLATTVTLRGPSKLVDERTAELVARWTASDGTPVSAGAVTLQRKLGRGAWKVYARYRTSSRGGVRITVRPRVDSTWRAIGSAASWWLGDTSPGLRIDNVPPIAPVVLPAAAPRPAHTPLQPRATVAGAHVVISKVSAGVWRSMVGRSWHRGCPVGRSGLRVVRVNYWGYDGYRRRGEIVVATAVAGRAGAALREMYAGHYPIRRMYRVDRFGWSTKLQGANDYASMRAGNTSGFNCRSVVNRPGVLSPHARGRAIDVNTWENPYHSATGWVPNGWWASRSHRLVAWRAGSHPVVRIWRRHGFHWTYGTGDSQHVDGRSLPPYGSFTG